MHFKITPVLLGLLLLPSLANAQDVSFPNQKKAPSFLKNNWAKLVTMVASTGGTLSAMYNYHFMKIDEDNYNDERDMALRSVIFSPAVHEEMATAHQFKAGDMLDELPREHREHSDNGHTYWYKGLQHKKRMVYSILAVGASLLLYNIYAMIKEHKRLKQQPGEVR